MTSRLGRSLLHLPLIAVLLAVVLSSAERDISAWRGEAAREETAESANGEGAGDQAPVSLAGENSDGVAIDLPAAWPIDAGPPGGAPDGAPRAPAGGPGNLALSSYKVEPGDSLADIAQRFSIDVSTLLGANDLSDPDLLPVGQELTIMPVAGVLYRVEEGDTLNSIADQYELSVNDILAANRIESSELIRPGDQLILPGARPLHGRIRPGVEGDSLESDPGSSVAQLAFTWPAYGDITTYFGEVGWTSPRGHAGLDIAAPMGAPVVAAAAGEVVVATRAGGPYGIQVVLEHGNGLQTVYGHLSQLNVEVGEKVGRGDVLGLIGSTGFSTGPHLHFEVRVGGELHDPLGYLP